MLHILTYSVKLPLLATWIAIGLLLAMSMDRQTGGRGTAASFWMVIVLWPLVLIVFSLVNMNGGTDGESRD